MGALGVALTRPPGVPERRARRGPVEPRGRAIAERRAASPTTSRGSARRSTTRPSAGLKPLDETASVAAWESGDTDLTARLIRLDERGILDAAGFLLHDPDLALL